MRKGGGLLDTVIKREFMPGVTLICVRADQFKSGYFSVTLLRQLDKNTASKDAIIPRILRRGCQAYPDMKSLSARLDSLYGAGVWPTLRQRGEVLCPGLACSFVEDRFLPARERTMEKTVSLLAQILLDPFTKDGLLNSDYVATEKEVLLNDIRSVVNDKRSYAQRRLREIMFSEECYAAYALGSVETASRLHYRSLTSYYREMLAESEMIFFYCGQMEAGEAALVLREAFASLPRGEMIPMAETEIRVNSGELKLVTEEMAVAQGNLAMGFRLGETMYCPDYAAIGLFNSVFGGSSSSKLFRNVREKLGLCYYVSSSLDSFKGIMIVSSGIAPRNFEAARDEIMEQLEACRRGEIDEREFETARRRMITSFRGVSDSPDALDSFYLTQELRELRCDPAEMIGLAQMAVPEDLVRVAESVLLDTVYFLKPKEGGGTDEADGL